MYAVGIDVSKLKSTVAITTIDGKLIEKPFEVLHNRQHIQLLIKKLKTYQNDNLKIVMEATSHYHIPLLLSLTEHDFYVCVENALVIKKFCDIDLRKAKNDKKDAIKLAAYCSEKWHKLRRFQPTDAVREDLIFLSREYSKFVKTQTRLKIQMNDLIDKTFPGISKIVNAESRFPLFLNIYEKYWHPDRVLCLSRDDFIEDIDSMAKKTRT